MTEHDGPKAAVVITNYNYARFVGAAIDSALAQTVDCQVIVVDDGSTDDSLAVIGTRQSGDRSDSGGQQGDLVVVAKPNGGQASAFNAGWARVTAPVVLFLDGDDVLEPEAVARVIDAFERNPGAARFHFRLRWIDERGQKQQASYPEPGRPLPSGDLRSLLVRAPDDIAWQPTSGNAFSAAVLEQILPMPEAPYRLSADHYLSNISALYGPVVGIETDLGGYRVHGDNGDFRGRFDLDRIRDILVRTGETRRQLIAHGQALDLAVPPEPDGFRSMTTAGLRLVSYRLRSDGVHPFPNDRWWTLSRDALAAAWGRREKGPVWRTAACGWVVAAAVAPRRFIPRLSAVGFRR